MLLTKPDYDFQNAGDLSWVLTIKLATGIVEAPRLKREFLNTISNRTIDSSNTYLSLKYDHYYKNYSQ